MAVNEETGTSIIGLDETEDIKDAGILRSTDEEGKKFTQIASMSTCQIQGLTYANGLWIACKDAGNYTPGYIWLSKDDGLTWEDYSNKILKDKTVLPIKDINGVEIDKDVINTQAKTVKEVNWGFNTVKYINGKYFIAVSSYLGCDKYGMGFILTTEDFKSFTFIELAKRDGGNAQRYKTIWELCGNPDGSTIVAATYEGFQISKDGGQTFNVIVTGDTVIDKGNFKGITFGNNRFVATSNFYGQSKFENSGIFYSDENGENWKWVGDIKTMEGKILNRFYSIEYKEEDNVFFATARGSGDYVGGICYSNDGVNWEYVFPGKFKTCFKYKKFWYAYDITDNDNKLILLQYIKYGSDFNIKKKEIKTVEDLIDIVIKLAKLCGWDNFSINLEEENTTTE